MSPVLHGEQDAKESGATCFPTSSKVSVSQDPVPQGPPKDDVVAMILGSENGNSRSNMSWADDEMPGL